MTATKINNIINAVKERNPLIHCITNPISINQCANAVLAIGGRPIMAEHPDEVEEITKTSHALLLNLGNITDARMKSMLISSEAADKDNIPFAIDLVGISCSKLRRSFADKLIKKNCPSVIKGNYSEINALYNSSYSSQGVDSDSSLTLDYISSIAVKAARKYNTIILASGKTDIITDGKRLFHIKNGTASLASVTGTGCMLGVLCACYLSVSHDIYAVTAACVVLGICGELSETDKGCGSFMVNLMDNLSVLSDVNNYLKSEEIKIENI